MDKPAAALTTAWRAEHAREAHAEARPAHVCPPPIASRTRLEPTIGVADALRWESSPGEGSPRLPIHHPRLPSLAHQPGQSVIL